MTQRLFVIDDESEFSNYVFASHLAIWQILVEIYDHEVRRSTKCP